MANFGEVGPSKPVVEAIRVDKVTPGYRLTHTLRAILVLVLAVILLVPVFVMVFTAFKTRPDAIHAPPKIIFTPSLEGIVFLFTERAAAAPGRLETLKKAA